MKKIFNNKNIYRKYVHNLKSKIYHENSYQRHILSKDLVSVYSEMGPIYQSLDIDYSRVDLIDFEYYERWLNG